MDPWTNIEVTPDDPEISQINEFEGRLGKLPEAVHQIRKLIFGYEVCHFKHQQHASYIKTSIINLEPARIPEDIGKHHLRHGDHVLEKDKSGRSLLGQNYISSLTWWLDENDKGGNLIRKEGLFKKIKEWLGQREPEKERLVRLLIARLKWDWKSYENLLKENANRVLESQVCRMDVCHYNFPNIIDSVIRGIGKLEPVDSFEGCGSYNSDIKSEIESELSILIDKVKSIISSEDLNKSLLIQAWLFTCFAKILKAQLGLKQSLLGLLK
jgi:hypothetical protein